MLRGVAGLVCFLGLGCCGWAQEMTAGKIVFRDAGPYAQADLESVAGLHPGSKMVLADLQAAAQRLADTGCFEEVKIDSQGAASALTAIFLLKPAAAGEVHPVEFANLVWFSPEELQAVVHKAAPLSAKGLPELTAVLDNVSAELESALAGKGVMGARVGHRVATASSSTPRTAVVFGCNGRLWCWGRWRWRGFPPRWRLRRQR